MKIVSAHALRALVAPVFAPVLITAALLAAAPAVQAQNAMPTGVRGTVTSLTGDVLKVHTRDGKDVDVKLAKDTPIRGVVLASVNDIKPDSYVGTAAIPQADGTLKALEVHVFPASMRGSGEGHRPWDLGGNSSMTNGTVGSLVVSNGRTITVKYKDGEKKIVIPQDVPIVALEPGDRSLLVPGAKVVMFAHKDADGSMAANFISAGEHGVTPPM
jgi:RNase P/RNase MRP subunit p29